MGGLRRCKRILPAPRAGVSVRVTLVSPRSLQNSIINHAFQGSQEKLYLMCLFLVFFILKLFSQLKKEGVGGKRKKGKEMK